MKNDSAGSRAKSSASWRNQREGREGLKQRVDTNSQKSSSSSQIKYRLGAYIRLSPSNEIRDEGSLVSHPQRIEQYVSMRNAQHGGNWGKIVEWYTDKEISGATVNRPSFQRMCRDLKEGKINGVIVTEISRLSRSVKDFSNFWAFLESCNAQFFSLRENFDTATPAGRAMVYTCMSFSQFERENTVERIRLGAKARAERGLANGNQRILGYDPDPNKKCHLVVNEKERPIAELVFRKFLDLGTLRNLQKFLIDEGYKTKEYTTRDGRHRGGRRWTISSLYNLLTNRAYIGQREFNKHNRTKDQTKLKENDRYFYFKAQWTPIIEDDLFFDAQDLLETNKRRKQFHNHIFRLTGLLHCGICGDPMVGKSGTSKHGTKHYYYGHNRKMLSEGDQHLKRCRLERIQALGIEEAVIAELGRLAKDKGFLKIILEGSSQSGEQKNEKIHSLLKSREQQRREQENKLNALTGALTEADLPDVRKVIFEKIADTKALADKISQEIESLKNEVSTGSSNIIDLSSAFKVLKEFRGNFHTYSVTEQAEVLRDVIAEVVLQEDEVKLDLYGVEKPLVFSPPEGFHEPSRAGVRPLFNLVEAVGVEPTSECLHSALTTCVAPDLI